MGPDHAQSRAPLPGSPLRSSRPSTSRDVAAGCVDGPRWQTAWVREAFWTGGPARERCHSTQWTPLPLAPATVTRVRDYNESGVPHGLWRVAPDRPTNQLLQQIGFEWVAE